jgi:hypothetical protein
MGWPLQSVTGTCPEIQLDEIGNPLASIKASHMSVWAAACVRLHDHCIAFHKMKSVRVLYCNLMKSKLEQNRAKILAGPCVLGYLSTRSLKRLPYIFGALSLPGRSQSVISKLLRKLVQIDWHG